MKHRDQQAIKALSKPLVRGAITGVRSTAALPFVFDGKWVRWFQLGEALVDKFPWAPTRTSLSPFVSRVLLGAWAGSKAAKKKSDRWMFAAMGAGAAAASTYLACKARKAASDKHPVAGFAGGWIEDAAVKLASRAA